MKIVRKAFTLIELMVTIAIIGILAVLVFISIGHAETRARNSKAENDINIGGTAIATYLTENDVVLAAVAASPGAGSAYNLPKPSSLFGIEPAFAAAGVPHGDQYSSAVCNSYSLLFATPLQTNYYYVTIPTPPTSFYVFSYRTQDNLPLANACPGSNDYHQNSAFQTYTLLTNLDTSDGSTNAYYWVNNGTSGQSTSAAGIPAP